MSKARTPRLKSRAKTAYGLLSEVRALIVNEPRRFYQGDWRIRESEPRASLFVSGFPPCGTVCCVAGWVCELKQPRTHYHQIMDKAARILGLGDQDQVDELFRGDAVIGMPGTRQYAADGAKHIAAFQKRYAKQLKAKSV